MTGCRIPGCRRVHDSHGLCGKHVQQRRAHVRLAAVGCKCSECRLVRIRAEQDRRVEEIVAAREARISS